MAQRDSEQSIFLHAIGLQSTADRAAYLAEVCRDNPALRADLDALVAAHDRLGGGLSPTTGPASVVPAAADGGMPGNSGTEVVGAVLAGRYKLLEQIGEGGMGTVWMARQTEPVKRLVAIKLIKPGMDSKQVLARFEAERQALALMDHPNIAKVHDAGTGPDSRPYFVMELVKGVPLTKYCDEHRLAPRQRLELFIPVCQAIQHAHQKGIIHRDIKPSNVLVALYDGKPVPKVIDFGIAKATGQQLTEQTFVTGFGAVVGTLEYMSPEQAELNQLDIDTRSDIYSLGVLLYELLTGTTPLERKRLKEAAVLEVLRLIREEEPPRPSTRLSESKDTLPSISAQRQMEPARLTSLVRGELDWIVMKALEKDRNRRYESANGFAQDVQRYLADEPVQACPPSAWYRFRKFARRHKMGLAVAALALCLVASLVGGIGWVVRDRAAQEQERVRDQEVRQAKVVNDLELALDRGELFQGQGKRPEALAALDRAELLANQAPADPVRDERLATLKSRLAAEARDQQFLTQFDKIRLELQSQVHLQENKFDWDALPEIEGALKQYGIAIGVMAPAEAAALVQSRPEAIRRQLIAALDECVRLTAQGDTGRRRWLLAVLQDADNDPWRVQVYKAFAERKREALQQLAEDAHVDKQPPSFLCVLANCFPVEMISTQLKLLRRAQRAYPGDLWVNLYLADALGRNGQLVEAARFYTAALALRPNNPGIYQNRGIVLHNAGDVDGAIDDYRQALALAPQYTAAHVNLGAALLDKGQLDEAIAECREAIRIKKDYPDAHLKLGNALRLKGQVDDAIAEYREAIHLKKDFPEAHNNLGNVLQDKGQLDEAIAAYREAIRLKKDNVGALNNLGNALKSKGHVDEAIATYREAIHIKKDVPEAHMNLGIALKSKGQLDEAIAECREAIRLKKDFAMAHFNLGNAVRLKGQLDEAIAEYREAINCDKNFADAHNHLGNGLLLKGQLDDAIVAYREAIRLKQGGAEAHCNLGHALYSTGQVDEAISEHREAIRLKPDYAEAQNGLGNALRARNMFEEAATAFREAIRLDKTSASPQCSLGLVLRQQGKFHDALEELRRGHQLGSKTPGWSAPSAQWVRECEYMIELDARLPDFLDGKITPANLTERIELAQLCTHKRLHRAAVRFYEDAFADTPKLRDQPGERFRYDAARAAALAGCGQGGDAGKLDEKERARLRRQALVWMRADLEAWGRLLDKEPQKLRPLILLTMRHWLVNSDFACVHEPTALTGLPEAERQSWQQMWSDVAELLGRAMQKTEHANGPATR
jgi:tetratricopeptide (TPR) repeat protein